MSLTDHLAALRASRPRRRAAGAALAIALGTSALVLTGAGDDDAVVPLETAAVEAVPVDLDPLAGITLADAPVVAPIDPSIQLPEPEPAPRNAYAPTPEVRHGMLEIPAIGLSQPLFEGVTLTAINRGPSHWPGTAMPGEVGNVVIAGHRTTYTRPFWDLQALEPGDELIFAMADGERHVYELVRTEVISPTDIHIIDQSHERTATLFACHPRGSARQRIVGHFEMKPPTVPVAVADTHQIRAPAA